MSVWELELDVLPGLVLDESADHMPEGVAYMEPNIYPPSQMEEVTVYESISARSLSDREAVAI